MLCWRDDAQRNICAGGISLRMATYRVLVFEGDGIGPEIVAAAVRVIDAATGGRIAWTKMDFVCLQYTLRDGRATCGKIAWLLCINVR